MSERERGRERERKTETDRQTERGGEKGKEGRDETLPMCNVHAKWPPKQTLSQNNTYASQLCRVCICISFFGFTCIHAHFDVKEMVVELVMKQFRNLNITIEIKRRNLVVFRVLF